MIQENKYESLVNRITSILPVNQIYLLGQREAIFKTTSIFIHCSEQYSFIDHLFLLIVIPTDNATKKHVLEEKIEAGCSSEHSITVLVLDTTQFNSWLQERHAFAFKVMEKAPLLFGLSVFRFDDTHEIDHSDYLKEKCFAQGINKVNEFMAGADLYRIRKQNKMAAFMLHQAVEQGLISLIKIKTGLGINSHNTERLIRYCSMVCPNIQCILPQKSENDKRLMRLLQRAYIESRYRDDFAIDGHEITKLFERVSEIHYYLLSSNQGVS